MKQWSVLLLALALQPGLHAQDVKTLQETARSFMGQGDFNNAVLVLNKALQQDPSNLEVSKDLALAYFQKSDYTRSQATVKPLLERTDADPAVYQLAGMLYKTTGDEKECDCIVEHATSESGGLGVPREIGGFAPFVPSRPELQMAFRTRNCDSASVGLTSCEALRAQATCKSFRQRRSAPTGYWGSHRFALGAEPLTVGRLRPFGGALHPKKGPDDEIERADRFSRCPGDARGLRRSPEYVLDNAWDELASGKHLVRHSPVTAPSSRGLNVAVSDASIELEFERCGIDVQGGGQGRLAEVRTGGQSTHASRQEILTATLTPTPGSR